MHCQCSMVRYCLKATSQTNDYLCSYRARTLMRLKRRNALNLSLYSAVESVSKLGSRKKTRQRINLSMYLYPVALLSLVTFVFAYSIRKSRLVRILKTHSLHTIRARKSQKVVCVCDVAFEQYRIYTRDLAPAP